MCYSKTRYGLFFELIILVIFVIGLAGPVSAAPGQPDASGRVMANHVDPADCDVISVGAGGSILVDGVALTAAQLALLDSDAVAALEFAAAAAAATDADASECTDVAIVLAPPAVTVNADISVCSVDVAVNADGTADLGDVTVGSNLLDSTLETVLQVAADAGAEACVTATVTDNEVAVDGSVQLCATATLNADGSLTVNGLDLDVDALLDVNGELQIGVEVEVALAILASVDLADDAAHVVATVIDIPGCGDSAGGTPSGTGSASPSVSPSSAGGGSGATPSQLPNTASTDSVPSDSMALGLAALWLLAMVTLLTLAYRHRLIHWRG
jgi:hypothetical protein